MFDPVNPLSLFSPKRIRHPANHFMFQFFVSFHQSIPRLLDLLMNRGVSMLPDFHLVPLDLFCSPYSVLAVSQCTILMWFIRIKI